MKKMTFLLPVDLRKKFTYVNILSVGISDEKATGMSTEVSVSKKSSKASSKSGYHISNNFK